MHVRSHPVRLAAPLLLFVLVHGPVSRAHAAWELVHVVPWGQFYHRPDHLVLPQNRAILPVMAIRKGYKACPECSPPEFTWDGRKTFDSGSTPYYEKYLGDRDPLFTNEYVKPGRAVETFSSGEFEASRGIEVLPRELQGPPRTFVLP